MEAERRRRRFREALQDGNTEEMRRLVKERPSGVNPNRVGIIQSRIGEVFPSTLHYCCYYKMIDVVRLCFEHEGADFELKDGAGMTPLHCACSIKNSTSSSSSSSLELVTFLVEVCKSNVHARTHHMETPLHLAAAGDAELDVVRYLVEQGGADVNAQDSEGFTPLPLWSTYENTEIDLYLVRHGLRVNARILDLAWRRYRSWTVKQALVANYYYFFSNTTRTTSEDVPDDDDNTNQFRNISDAESYCSKFPLHVALQTPLPTTEAFLEFLKKSPSHSVSLLDPNGNLPLHLAVRSVICGGGCVVVVAKTVFELEQRAATVRDSRTGFYPYEAAAAASKKQRRSDLGLPCDGDNHHQLDLVYSLFRHNPEHFLTARRL